MAAALQVHTDRRLVLASGNRGKLAEMRELLLPLRAELIAQSDLGIEGAAEPHITFLENALAKARHVSALSRLPALADDSGLCCEALGGLPGVRSARFAGEHASDAQNNAELARQLNRRPERRAHFVCVIVAVRSADDPEPLVAEGRWLGEFLDTPRGEAGFGYDPHFLVSSLGRTAAELPAAQKNQISHRAMAMKALVVHLRERWSWV